MFKKKQSYSKKPQAPVEKSKGPEKPQPIDAVKYEKYISQFGIKLDADSSKAMLQYLDTLMLWNTRVNLVGTLEWKQTFSELIIDSFYLAEFFNKLALPEEPTTWDLGSGAGLPGIPLRMVWKKGTYTLIESREKRALFMTNFLIKQPLENTKVSWQRAEVFFEKQEGKQADMVVSRAFMPYLELLEFVQPFVKKGGYVILMSNDKVEINDTAWKIYRTMPYDVSVTDSDSKQLIKITRYFHAIEKII